MPVHGYSFLEPGALFHDRYRIDHCIKAGGMGAVYEVIDETTDSRRALKVMLPSLVENADLRARFELEARVTGKIESDHLARVSDAGVDAATAMPFLVMDLLQGEELGSMLARRKTLPPGEVVLYLFEAALALDKTHAAGIVHRDLKPDNLFITPRDDGLPCVKVFDFGIAKVVNRSAARTTRPIGTPLYMAPEQMRGDGSLGPAADLYALGHIAYALLVGEPYWAEDVENSSSVLGALSTIILGVKEPATVRAMRTHNVVLPAAFDTWFLKATATRPEDRFGRATDTVAALAIALGVSLPRAMLAIPLAAELTPAASGSGTMPLSERRSEAPGLSSAIEPSELRGATMTSPPLAARLRRRNWLIVGLAVGTALAVTAIVAPRLRIRNESTRGAATGQVQAQQPESKPSVQEATPRPDVLVTPSASTPLPASSAAPSAMTTASTAPSDPTRPPRHPPTAPTTASSATKRPSHDNWGI